MSPDEGSRRQPVRAMVASTVGTSLEWYDFFLYGTVAALVFPISSSRRRRGTSGSSRPSRPSPWGSRRGRWAPRSSGTTATASGAATR